MSKVYIMSSSNDSDIQVYTCGRCFSPFVIVRGVFEWEEDLCYVEQISENNKLVLVPAERSAVDHNCVRCSFCNSFNRIPK